MSLVQVWLEGERALVAVDTKHILGGEILPAGRNESSKIVPLPHASVVLAFRGSGWAFFQVFAQLYLTAGNDGFDSISKAMPTRVRDAASHLPQLNLPPEAVRCTLFVVGHSESQGCMAATMFEVDLRTGAAAESPIPHARIGPAVEGASSAELVQTAKRQVAWMHEHEPERATGGRLLVAEVTRDSIAIRDAGSL